MQFSRDQRGYRSGEVEYDAGYLLAKSAQLVARTPAENLARVCAVLMPSISELADIFSVSQQTIYNWQSGHAIAHQNEDRLERLARSADFISDHGLAQKPSVLRRPISRGMAFLELVKGGSDPEAVAHRLVSTMQHELKQRKSLDDRLSNRARKRVDMGEIGAPHMDEDA